LVDKGQKIAINGDCAGKNHPYLCRQQKAENWQIYLSFLAALLKNADKKCITLAHYIW
jgi:hypothetical protein